MKTHNKTFRRLLVALLTIIGNAFGISAHPLSFNYTETDETADSAGVFNEGILYPVVSNQVPTSLTGSRGEWYYTPDHYKTFIRFVP